MPSDGVASLPGAHWQNNFHPPEHANPNVQIEDSGPQKRQSRLPLFNQVRAMLHSKPTASASSSPVSAHQPKWDAYTGELSETGQPSSVQPSTYTVPLDDEFVTTPTTPPGRSGTKMSKLSIASSASSPISILRDESIRRHRKDPEDWSPVSPIETLPEDTLVPKPLTPRQAPLQARTPVSANSNKHIKRKPAPRSASRTENIPPQSVSPSPPNDVERRDFEARDRQIEQTLQSTPPTQNKSRFSWTTYDTSNSPDRQIGNVGRPSLDTTPSRSSKMLAVGDTEPKSRFSWSTVNTGTTAPHHEIDPEPCVPPVPDKYSSQPIEPPVQSILSRRRPIQRYDREEWIPPKPDRTASDLVDDTPRSTAAGSTISKRGDPLASTVITTNPPATGKAKALPPPPALAPAEMQTLTHLEMLLKQQQDLAVQRRNVEKAIAELVRFERSSPLSVSWAALRDAREKLRRNRLRLAEIQWEERDVGVAISRARRKEGAEEGLWVRRVTG